jgi:FAD/FMN-containing dehydrogenase
MTTKKDIFRLRELLGEELVRDDPDTLELYGKDWIKDYTPAPAAILFPKTKQQVAEVVNYCHQEKLALVPSGGRTGLSGGATATNGELVLSLSKMNKIIQVNTLERTVTCEAGVITQNLIDSVAKDNLFFPIDFASKGSSHIGGNIATNAGGIRVVRWGLLRDWVRGLTVVTAPGDIINLNGSLIKNQTGYDLRSLFIGSEGTLGIIVEATLKLAILPKDPLRLLCGLESLEKVLELFYTAQKSFSMLNAFEYFSRAALDLVMQHNKLSDPLQKRSKHYALIEIEGSNTEALADMFVSLLEKGVIEDIVISQSNEQANSLLAYREIISETLSSNYTIHKNDISVPIASQPKFIADLTTALESEYPGYQVIIFGHIGDGNLHINLIKPKDIADNIFYAHCKKADDVIFSIVQKYRGSISAEHGVGLLKRDYLHYSRTQEEISMMKRIKLAIDPHQIMNPGKIFI